MGFKELLENFKNKNFEPKGDDYDDNKTRDNYLRSLRRQRRIQLEEVEKEQLKREIKEYEHLKARKNLWGMQSNTQKEVNLRKIKKLKMLGKL